jgi:hypothetical protein
MTPSRQILAFPANCPVLLVMLLTDHEREFLAAFVYEATTDPFKGPATEALHRRDIYYNDLSHLLTAYSWEESLAQEGFGGRHNPAPPPCPWVNRETAPPRDRETQAALEKTTHQPVS